MKLVTFDIADANALNQFKGLANLQYKNETGDYAALTNEINSDLFIIGLMAVKNENTVSRCILYRAEPHQHQAPVIFFGHFEATDLSSAQFILQSMSDYCRQRFPEYQLIGPVNGNTWNSYRIALNQLALLFPNDICSGTFYHAALLRCGFEIIHQYHTNLQTDLQLRKKFTSSHFQIAFFSKEQFAERLPAIYRLTMDAFQHAVLFSPITEKQFTTKQLALLPALEMNLLPFVVDEQKQIIAYALCYRGFEKDTLVVKTIARKKGRIYAGTGRLLSEAIIRMAAERGIHKIYHAFIHEHNASMRLSAGMYGKTIKSYALYKLSNHLKPTID
jgi:L-amino acid N-acyltransferase YncA